MRQIRSPLPCFFSKSLPIREALWRNAMQPLQLHLMLQFLVLRRFTFTKSFVAFASFALFLEASVGQSAPALAYLCQLLLIQSGMRSQDAGLGTLVTGPCWCMLLFSDWRGCVSFRFPWDRPLVSGLSTLSEHMLFNWGRSSRRRTERSSQDGTLNWGRAVYQVAFILLG